MCRKDFFFFLKAKAFVINDNLSYQYHINKKVQIRTKVAEQVLIQGLHKNNPGTKDNFYNNFVKIWENVFLGSCIFKF